MSQIGIIEGFFGPQWSTQDRVDYALFLSKFKKSFYLYAPKRDAHLRRDWRNKWSREYIYFLEQLARQFQSHQVEFGIGLSPFGLGTDQNDDLLLEEKIKILDDLGIQKLGLFFDDMEAHAQLAQYQLEALELVRVHFRSKVVFCPSFYSFDSILEKVFGKRPDRYWQDLQSFYPSEIDYIWTGNKVISPEISQDDLLKAQEVLGRKPFLWENLYANDGPKNCRFLKLHPYTGRDKNLLHQTQGIAFNLMNQAQLSKIVFQSSALFLTTQSTPEECFAAALQEQCSPTFADFVVEYRDAFQKQGYDILKTHAELKEKLQGFKDPAAIEILEWLQGAYIVGPECLTE